MGAIVHAVLSVGLLQEIAAPAHLVVTLMNSHGEDTLTESGQDGAPYAEQLASATAVLALAINTARLMRRTTFALSKLGSLETAAPQNGHTSSRSFTCRPHPLHKKSFILEV